MQAIEKIHPRQFFILVFLYVVGDAVLYVPGLLTAEAKQDAWVSAMIGWAEGIIMVLLYSVLSNRYPGLSLIEYSETLLGKWLGKMVGILFISYLFIDASLMLMEIGDFVTTVMMPETPIEVTLILFAGIIVLGTFFGLETIARTGELLFPWFIFLFLLMIVFVLPKAEPTNMQPVLAQSFTSIVSGNLRLFGYMLETVILIILFPYVKASRLTGKAYQLGVFLGNSVLTIVTAVSILVLGAEITVMYAYPSYSLARKIEVGDFFERIEAIMAIIWFISIYLKITICFFGTSLGLAQVLALKDYRPLVVPLGFIMVPMAIASVPNRPYFDMFVSKYWMPYSLTYGLVLPLLLLLLSFIFDRKKNEETI